MRVWRNCLRMPSRHVLWTLALLFLLGLAFAGWQWSRTFRLVARFACVDEQVTPCAAGFLLEAHANTYTFRDWRGRVRWTVHAPPPGIWRAQWYGTHPWEGMLSLSPHGRTLAKITTANGKLYVNAWRDGKAMPPVAFPAQRNDGGFPAFALAAQDDGRVFLWAQRGPAFPIYLIMDGRIVARNVMPRKPRYWSSLEIAPDGSHAVLYYEIARQFTLMKMTVRSSTVTLTPLYTDTYPRNPSIPPQVMSNGVYLTGEGGVFRGGTALRTIPVRTNCCVAPAGQWAFTYRLGQGLVANLATGDRWLLTLPGDYPGTSGYAEGITDAAVSDSGRFVLVSVQERPVLGLRKRLPNWRVFHRFHDDEAGWAQYQALYARPGRLVTRFTPAYRKWGGDWLAGAQWHMAPDGRALVTTISIDHGATRGYRVILLGR
jgi:hypothetical protein